jgi:hypothetical protein
MFLLIFTCENCFERTDSISLPACSSFFSGSLLQESIFVGFSLEKYGKEQMKKEICWLNKALLTFCSALILFGCAREPHPGDSGYEPAFEVYKSLNTIQFVIQVGAFNQLDNALRLTENLNNKGLQACYYIHESGLYKVRFGNFPTYQDALSEAEALRKTGVLAEYYIVKPQEFAVARLAGKGEEYVREKLVSTAESFLGVPYKWGGVSGKTGFDCSGLSMVVYKLNGINLPRNSRTQYKAGRTVRISELRKGDLVFFSTEGGHKVSHVGIYIGGGQFIHAPKRGKKIEFATFKSGYFKKRLIGAKTYL